MTWRRWAVLRGLWCIVSLIGASHAVAQSTTKAAAATPASVVTSPHGTELKEACASCHKSDSWKPAQIAKSFRHAERTFPLAGAHERVACMSCHTQLNFKGATNTCASCHSDPHKGEFGASCARCHNTRSFIDRGTAVRTHQATRFPLRGAHAVAVCEACHTQKGPGQQQFVALGTTCQSCHMETFRATTSPSHTAASFSSDCVSCHTISTWSGALFDHNTTKFPLTGTHQRATCQGCHTDNVYTGRSTTCVSCHQADYAGAQSPKHGQGFPTTCESCHGTTQWQGARFDHQTQTRYPLTGKHLVTACSSCHTSGTYAGTPTTCINCHQQSFSSTTKPPHQAAGFSNTCEGCHTTATWTGAVFDHSTTRFELTGGHRAVTCASCHADNVYRGKPMACASCHQANANATTNPHHVEARFSATCESCHTTTAWAGAQFNHSTTRFALTGRHIPATCLACHADKVYAGKPATCVSCHQTSYDGTAQPNHRVLGFPVACESCHNTAQWLGAQFNHSTNTNYPLTGAHQALTCQGCHGGGVYRGTPTTCVGCHQTRYDATTSPHHAAAGFATACASCHTTQQWTGLAFDHTQTRFPLLGRHIGATCLACHSDRVYAGKPSVCQSCHQAAFDATTAPNHRAAGIPTTCESCHTATGWQPSLFNHDQTQFPLQGAHRAVNCQSCHSDGVYRGKPTTCASCHQAKFDATTQPDHRAAGYSTTCQTCHTNVAWTPAAFDHNATQFPLVGAHRAVVCESCHSDGVYRGKPTNCASCHQAKFDATTAPNHRTSGFPNSCQTCHTSVTWTPATFDHATTQFPLVGAHRAVTCASCHSDGVFRGKPTDCASCHQAKFDATTAPNHRTSGFPNTCQTCHTSVTWTPATFDHAATQFPLAGAHRAVSCASCHSDGVFKGKPTTCVSCHQAKFNSTTQPNHSTLGYATTCQSCHTTVAWVPSSWDHSTTQFPLTGAHRSSTCLACHADGVYRGKPKVCSACHLTDYNATANPNHQAAFFPTTCESCHSTTQWNGATFNHDGPWFPIYSGAHKNRWTTCAQCHTNNANFKEFTCLSCHEHRQSAMDSKHSGRNGYSYTSIACYSCHPRGKH